MWGYGVVARETRWFAEFRLKNILISGNSRTISRIFKGDQNEKTTEKTLHLRFVMIRVVIKGLGGRFSDFKMGHGSLKLENSCAALSGKTEHFFN